MCIQSIYSPEARNKWFIKKTEYNPVENDTLPDENLDWLLGQLLKISENTNPNSRQASSIWMLAVVKNCGKREPISERLETLQNTFLRLLGENNGNSCFQPIFVRIFDILVAFSSQRDL